MSHWISPDAAERYSNGRTAFHGAVIDHLTAILKAWTPVAQALDVGCGTGLSSIALKPIARCIEAIDISEPMIAHAPKDSQVTFSVASAESLPFRNGQFDLLSNSESFHWLPRAEYFREARRVLKDRGWLVVYDNFFNVKRAFADDSIRSAMFHEFYSSYRSHFPSPSRGVLEFDDAHDHGFELTYHTEIPNTTTFNPQTLRDYMLTQSTISAALALGESLDDVMAWLTPRIAAIFSGRDSLAFSFVSPVWILRKK